MASDTQAAELDVRVTSPFARLRARWLLPAALAGVVVASGALTFIEHRRGARTLPDERLLGLAGYLGVLLVLIAAGRIVRLDWRRLLGRLPTRAMLPLVAVVIPVALLTFAAALVVYVPLSYVLPAFVERHVLALDALTNVTTLGQWFLLMLVGVVAAPVVEEILFRGLLLHRWSRRWGTTRAVVASSALFGVLHQEWIGHFLFGVALSALYLRTRSLWLPMLAHALNNAIALLGTLPSALSHRAEPVETLAEFRGEAWTIAPLLAAGLVTGWLYLRHWFPAGLRAEMRVGMPYENE